ncbi:MAG: flagellar basal body P-ring formation chaperone FlgA [Candidatus Margulisiibacteriota bacterium]
MKTFYSLLLLTGLTIAATVVDAAQIETQIRQAVNERYGNVYTKVEVTILGQPRISMENATYELSVRLPEKSLGLTIVPVTITSTKESRQVRVQANIRVYDQVLVAQQPVDRRQNLTELMVKVSQEEVTPYVLAKKDICKTVDRANGKRSKSFLKPGDILTADKLESIPDVLKDQVLSLIVEQKSLSIKLPVKALAEGFIGNTIQVLNPKSNIVLMARISDKQSVVLAN